MANYIYDLSQTLKITRDLDAAAGGPVPPAGKRGAKLKFKENNNWNLGSISESQSQIEVK
jgi:hypothetical protein